MFNEQTLGTQGPIEGEELHFSSQALLCWGLSIWTIEHCKVLFENMLLHFIHRKSDMIPSYNAAHHLESYFPGHLPYGRGGPVSKGLQFGNWIKNALLVHNSRFAKDQDFIFFIHSVYRRGGLSTLSTNGVINNSSKNAIVEVRDPLCNDSTRSVVTERIHKLLRSGTLNASFEQLRGSPAFWATLKKIFMGISIAHWTVPDVSNNEFSGPCRSTNIHVN